MGRLLTIIPLLALGVALSGCTLLSDRDFPEQTRCELNFFACQGSSAGTCVNWGQVCDNHPDCDDGSDEAYCCAPGEYQCAGTGECIGTAQLCDDYNHCSNGNDENVCSY